MDVLMLEKTVDEEKAKKFQDEISGLAKAPEANGGNKKQKTL